MKCEYQFQALKARHSEAAETLGYRQKRRSPSMRAKQVVGGGKPVPPLQGFSLASFPGAYAPGFAVPRFQRYDLKSLQLLQVGSRQSISAAYGLLATASSDSSKALGSSRVMRRWSISMTPCSRSRVRTRVTVSREVPTISASS